jgi:hypothetical protein
LENRRLASTRRIGTSLLVVGVIAALGVVGFAWLVATYGGLDYKCIVEGPHWESAPFALASEAARVRGHFSSWPLGRACDWERADGRGFVTAGPGWTSTIMFLVCVAIAVVAAVLLAAGDAGTRSWLPKPTNVTKPR